MPHPLHRAILPRFDMLNAIRCVPPMQARYHVVGSDEQGRFFFSAAHPALHHTPPLSILALLMWRRGPRVQDTHISASRCAAGGRSTAYRSKRGREDFCNVSILTHARSSEHRARHGPTEASLHRLRDRNGWRAGQGMQWRGCDAHRARGSPDNTRGLRRRSSAALPQLYAHGVACIVHFTHFLSKIFQCGHRNIDTTVSQRVSTLSFIIRRVNHHLQQTANTVQDNILRRYVRMPPIDPMLTA